MRARLISAKSEIHDVVFPVPDLELGSEYLVFGLLFSTGGIGYRPFLYYIVEDSSGMLIHAPSNLFELTNTNVSRYWILNRFSNGSARVEPREFSQDFFWDRMTDYEPEALKILDEIKKMLDSEQF